MRGTICLANRVHVNSRSVVQPTSDLESTGSKLPDSKEHDPVELRSRQ